ncbi:organic solvent tolerance protein [Sphingomonas sp. Leaf357]|uniref:LPS-assembly protein LptD n=1 Tax=Sphingomonas sp. Leaf357 TaxID=1736350 RepID=UPI00070177F1|nr:LPS assembly protein LptD [Sphingomonas sp. Leaf357]KQS05345.1 organic solvent tolerance protein [Sphingomonas sp. Leaf357]
MKRSDLLSTCAPSAALLLGLLFAQTAQAQDLQTPPTPPPSAVDLPTATDDQVAFSAGTLQYDTDSQIVTATGDVRMARSGDKLRADKVVWNRQTGKVIATGSIAVTNPGGDIAYGDSIELTDSLKDGMVDNMLVVLERGGRLAARKGTRFPDEKVELEDAAYTPCNVTTSKGCPKEPSWKITAVRVTYRPDRQRIYYKGAQINVFGLPTIPLPAFSHPIGGGSDSGLLSPDLRYSRTNGFEYAQPYYFRLAPNRGLTITPRVFTGALPLLKAQYTALDSKGAFSITGYGTYSRRSDDLNTFDPTDTSMAFRGYIDGIARYQFDPNWSASASIRLASDRTFLRRYDISYDDRLRSTARIERIDANSYFGITGWAVQTVRVNDSQGQQPIAIPEIDYRRRMDDGLLGGKFTFQANTLALTRTDGQDTQRGFVSARWDLRKLTRWGQEVTFTAFGRGDVYHTSDTLATSVLNYRGDEGVQSRVMGAVAVDVKWPLIGQFLGGTQRITPRVQIVASPHIKNLEIPNEDSRAVDLEDSNLFALNRFPGYDRIDDGTRVTYGADYALDLPGVAISTNIGQSYRLGTRSDIFPPGTGLDSRFSDFVGRTEVRYRDFVSLTHRYRLDKNGLAIRRNELDATIGSRATYLLLGYLKLNRNITTTEDLQDREEVRIAGRVQFARFWSLYGSSLVDLTNRDEDPLSVSDGFTPVRHRLGVSYEDDCLKIGFTWKHDYQSTGDARAGNGFLLSLSFKNLGR